MRLAKTLPLAALLAAVAGVACSSSPPLGYPENQLPAASDAGDSNPQGGYPFEPVSPQDYVPKVKNLLTGLPVTDDEVATVVADPSALKGLIDKWMALPEFQSKMIDFFRNAFQQNQVNLQTLVTTLNTNFPMNSTYQAMLQRNIMDSFARTAWDYVATGKPFNGTITTPTYMMTTAMMSFLSYADEIQVNDKNQTTNRLQARNQIAQFTIDPNSTATLAQTLNPADGTNYMVWHVPATDFGAGCTTPTAYTQTQANENGALYSNLLGFLLGRTTYAPCVANNGQANVSSQFADADWNDWRPVTLSVAAPTDVTSPVFYDILSLRSATTMRLHTQRIGFFGSLAFDANWATNAANEARVTANQTLIVSIGQSIDGENTIVNFPVNSADADHASNPACTGCHSQLDPFKQYIRQSYTFSYHDQTDDTQLSQPAGFAIDGVTGGGTGVSAMSNILSTHPRMALAWVEKLHFWANSTPAREDDPEVARIAAAFASSNYDFKTLVRELFSSPLVTYASGTTTTEQNGVILSIARRDQFCAALSNRLGLPDVCGQESSSPTNAQKTIASRAVLVASDTYYRAYALPSLPTNPDLFFRQSVESVCGLVASQVVDVSGGGTSRYVSTDPSTAILDMVSTVMDIPPADPRYEQAVAILTDNFTASTASGSNASDSLKATFTLACLAPSSVIVGL